VRFAALVGWVSTACVGLYLLISRLASERNKKRPAKATKYPALLMPGHPALALTGLTLWVCFLIEHRAGYAWAAFGVLCVTILLGFALLTRWLTGVGGRHAGQQPGHRPARVVVLHGLAALATFVLAMLTASIMSHG
jgi:hypothetical protein